MMRSCLRRSPRYASGNSCSLLLFFVCLFVCILIFFCLLFSLFFVTILVKLMFHSPPQKKTIKVIMIILMRVIFVHRVESSLICLERALVFLWTYSKSTNQTRYIFVKLVLQQWMLHVLPQSTVACCRSFYSFFFTLLQGFFSTSSNVRLA